MSERAISVRDGVPVVVIIATRPGRERLLLERALPSVFHQEQANPALVLVVEDRQGSGPTLSGQVEQVRREILSSRWGIPASEVPDGLFPTVVLLNRRTRGMSGTGAWNTAADEARLRTRGGAFLAFLDDDDAWMPGYLSHCLSAARGELGVPRTALVLSGLLRLEGGRALPQIPPVHPQQSDFFVGNPGVQGSNLFIAQEVFDAVGGFDETMPSTTDRDLMIRVLDWLEGGSWRLAHVDRCLVLHHAHEGERVTTNPEAKRRGLERFYARHSHRMSAEVLERSLDRARTLFGYTPGE
jgi:hypothetical protein